MRNTLIFAGSSVPELTAQICANLGMPPAPVELGQFANVCFQIFYLSGNRVDTSVEGRNQCQDHDQHPRKRRLHSSVREQQDQ